MDISHAITTVCWALAWLLAAGLVRADRVLRPADGQAWHRGGYVATVAILGGFVLSLIALGVWVCDIRPPMRRVAAAAAARPSTRPIDAATRAMQVAQRERRPMTKPEAGQPPRALHRRSGTRWRQFGTLQAHDRLLHRRLDRGHVRDGHADRHVHPFLCHRLHARRAARRDRSRSAALRRPSSAPPRPVPPLLPVPVAVLLQHAGAGDRRQHRHGVRVLGIGGHLLLFPDRLLHRAQERLERGQQGVHRQSRGRFRHDHRPDGPVGGAWARSPSATCKTRRQRSTRGIFSQVRAAGEQLRADGARRHGPDARRGCRAQVVGHEGSAV